MYFINRPDDGGLSVMGFRISGVVLKNEISVYVEVDSGNVIAGHRGTNELRNPSLDHEAGNGVYCVFVCWAVIIVWKN